MIYKNYTLLAVLFQLFCTKKTKSLYIQPIIVINKFCLLIKVLQFYPYHISYAIISVKSTRLCPKLNDACLNMHGRCVSGNQMRSHALMPCAKHFSDSRIPVRIDETNIRKHKSVNQSAYLFCFLEVHVCGNDNHVK